MSGRKGHKAWNKGLTKETDERVKKYSEKVSNSLKGKTKGILFSEKHKQNLSASLMGHIVLKETGEKISNKLLKYYETHNGLNLGKHHSEESREKNRISQTGKKQSKETIEKRRQKHIGSKRSEETRQKQSKSRKKYIEINGVWNEDKIGVYSEDTLQKMRDSASKAPKSEETKQKIKEKRKLQKNTWNPSTELKIQNFLTQLHIEYYTHKYINIQHSYQCDILIPKQEIEGIIITQKIIIECDGDYWHKFPIGRDIDKIRTQELIEQGFKVIRIWEHEIRKMNVENLKEKIK